MKPMVSEMRLPYSTRLKMSRPNLSVPIRWAHDGARLRMVTMSPCAAGSYGATSGVTRVTM